MTQPYESIYTGTFIYCLGFLAAEEGFRLDGRCVSLLAQNPGDHRIGDLVASWGGRNFIIEFKRNVKSIATELEKPGKSEFLAFIASAGGSNLRELSMKGHFLAYGFKGAGRCELLFARYCLLKEAAAKAETGVPLERFFKAMRDGRFGLAPREYRLYFDELLRRNPVSAGGGGRRGVERSDAGLSTLVINYDEATQRLAFVTVDLARARERTLGLNRGRSRDEPDLVR